ncbi:3-oxoacyl-ACP reductase FabG [Alicyclobacillus cycloheptanicus]|uniref:3-oxoacyl-[acyl-carrier protein] reductase n=1 Tax=Alicyclobacillus cycloheptanicus TaxID=1457 RepID=A0ABT9XLQ8_9BACL|nr:3-oxoacyl-ACP reductase FabG [Alicyclobacillus cycloheptanicus]MDQ0191246.1 3-oxoacyl-[acyl-carrier protein] reductase [Alicyclobacillus cycloheptanicus]WDM01520.1 3-oxoacyl-ACP reductase FabG [Alicyclobacillus cycloheptanicus]
MSEPFFSTTRPLFGQVAVVTGASRGIGRSIAIALARAGAHVVVNYRQSKDAADAVVDTCRAVGSRAIAVQADVTVPEDVTNLMVMATSLGVPRILINNAGISKASLLLETSLEDWNALVKSNLTASFLCAKAVLPYMLRAEYGRIINISSIWGIAGGSYEVAYSASKGGLIAFTKALAKEVGRNGVTVNCVAPGAIETDMLQTLTSDERSALAQETPVGRLGTPEDVAHTVLFLASPSASFMTGQVISPNGGLVI